MDYATKTVDWDGVAIPAEQALANVRDLIAATDPHVDAIRLALAQPIGETLDTTDKICRKIKTRIRKFLNQLDKATGEQVGSVVNTLGGYVADQLATTQTIVDSVGRAAAVGSSTSPAQPPVPTVPPPTATPRLSVPSALTGIGMPGLACPAGFPLIFSGPYGLWGGRNPVGGRCGIAGVSFQCHGTDSRPAWAVGVLFTDVIGGSINITGGGSFNPFASSDQSVSFDGDVDAAIAYANANFPAFAAGCVTGVVPPPPPPEPIPPAPTPIPQPQPAPAPAPTPVATCPAPPQFCVANAPAKPDLCPVEKIPDFLIIGSKAFCDTKDDIRGSFVALGREIASMAGKVDLPSFVGTTVGAANITALPGISDVVNGVLAIISEKAKTDTDSVIGLIRESIACWWKLVQTSTACNMIEVAFLCLAKATIEILQRFRVGWDVAIWGTLDLTVHIPPLVAVLDYLINDACPAEIPHVPDTIEAYLRNQITEEMAKCWLSLRGCAWDVWYPVIYARRHNLTEEEWIQWARRIDLDDATILIGLRYLGWLGADEAKAKYGLYDRLPSISDHLHWLQRGVFDTDYVRDYDLLNGFEDRFWKEYGHDLRALGVLKRYAQNHYAAHWINPSIGQLAEMAQRLRPGRVDPSVRFTWDDFTRVLVEQDVAPFFRERLRAISYRTLPIRQMTQLVRSRGIDEAELAERWQDIGFAPADAVRLAHALMIDGERQRASMFHLYTPARVAKLWPAGEISRADAHKYLEPQGMALADVDALLDLSEREIRASLFEKHTLKSIEDYARLATKAYGDGVVSRANAFEALGSAGYSPEAANLELDTIALRVRMDKIDAARNAVHKSFLRGEINATEAQTALLLAGMQPASAADFVERWTLELSVPRRSAETSRILRWAKDGIISVANAEARLANMGWNPPDIVLMIAELSQEIKRAGALAAQRSAKALAAASAASARAAEKITKSYCKLYSPGKLKLWYAERIIDESTLRDRLGKCGYHPEAIDSFVKEAEVARDERDIKATKKGKAGVEYAGPGADSG